MCSRSGHRAILGQTSGQRARDGRCADESHLYERGHPPRDSLPAPGDQRRPEPRRDPDRTLRFLPGHGHLADGSLPLSANRRPVQQRLPGLSHCPRWRCIHSRLGGGVLSAMRLDGIRSHLRGADQRQAHLRWGEQSPSRSHAGFGPVLREQLRLHWDAPEPTPPKIAPTGR